MTTDEEPLKVLCDVCWMLLTGPGFPPGRGVQEEPMPCERCGLETESGIFVYEETLRLLESER